MDEGGRLAIIVVDGIQFCFFVFFHFLFFLFFFFFFVVSRPSSLLPPPSSSIVVIKSSPPSPIHQPIPSPLLPSQKSPPKRENEKQKKNSPAINPK